MADRVVEQQERDAGRQQCDQVGHHEGAAAVLVGDVGEAPDVSESDRRADGRQDEDLSGAERPSSLLLVGLLLRDAPRRRAEVLRNGIILGDRMVLGDGIIISDGIILGDGIVSATGSSSARESFSVTPGSEELLSSPGDNAACMELRKN